MPELAARHALDLAIRDDWDTFERELLVPRARFVELTAQLEPKHDPDEVYATMRSALRSRVDVLAGTTPTATSPTRVDARVQHGFTITKVSFDDLDITVIEIDERHYVVNID